jgi:glutathione S-transferase
MMQNSSSGQHKLALLFTSGSPFARAIRIILDELGLDYERQEEVSAPTIEEHESAPPTMQVPALRDGERVLWESGLIAEYLLTEYAPAAKAAHSLAAGLARPNHLWPDKLVFSTIQTLGTAATTISQMKWSGVAHRDNGFLSRCASRLSHLMGWLENQLPDEDRGFLGSELSAQDIFLTCHLDFIANRPIDLDPELENHPKISALVSRLKKRPSFLRKTQSDGGSRA